MTASHGSPSSPAAAITASRPASDSATERPTLRLLWLSDADRNTLTSSNRRPSAHRFLAHLERMLQAALVGYQDRADDARRERELREDLARRRRAAESTSARTKLVSSMRSIPVRARASISSTLASVGMTSGSFWKPSRGPTSRIVAADGSGRSLVPTLITASLYSGAMPAASEKPVTVIGASGALGFGVAVRLAMTGVPIVIGSAGRRAGCRNRAARGRRGARGELHGARKRCRRSGQRDGDSLGAVPQPARDARQHSRRAPPRLAHHRRDRPPRSRGRRARDATRSASGRAPPQSRRRRRSAIVPGSFPRCTPSAPPRSPISTHPLDAGRAGVRRLARRQAGGRGVDRADRRACAASTAAASRCRGSRSR